MRLVTPPISEAKSFTAFFVEAANEAGLYKGPDGKPMVFYRGTQSKKNLFTNLGSLSFTDDPDVAKIYSARPKSMNFDFTADFVEGSTVGTYHLKMTNPIEIEEIDGTPLQFIDEYLGGLDTVGKEETLKLLAYLANRESGKAKGPRFQYDFHDDAEDYIDSDEVMGIEIGPSLKSLYLTVKNLYEYGGGMADIKDALDAVTIDYFVLIDAPGFKRLAKAAGYDGIIHTDAFDAGPMVSQKLLGKDVADQHLTYRPFDKTQVVVVRTKSMAPKVKKTKKEPLKESANAAKTWYHGTSAKMGRLIAKDKAIIPGKMPQQDRRDAQGDPNKVYLTDQPAIAEQYARRRGKGRAVIEIDASAIDWNKAEPDEEVLMWMYQNWDADKGTGSEEFLTPEDILVAFGEDDMSTIEDRSDTWQAIVDWIKKDGPDNVRKEWEEYGSQKFWDDMPGVVLEALPRGTPLWKRIMSQAWSISVPGPLPVKRVLVGNTAKDQKQEISLTEAVVTNQLEDIDVESIETGRSVRGYLYHGSREDDIEELEPYAPSYDGSLGWGLYLAEEPEARNYGRQVYRVPVELKNPFRIEHRPIEADPTGESIETLIDADLLDVLKEKGQSFKDWYEKWAGYGAEYNQPHGQDVDDVIDEEGNLPEEFLEWMKEEDRGLASEIAKHLVQIDEWYGKATRDAMAEAREKNDPSIYQEARKRLYEERKTKLEAINSQKLEDLWDEWPANNIPVIASSILPGESVAPFWFVLGDEVIGCFDAGDMESISPSVQEAGYDSMAVQGLRAFSSFLGHEVVLFRSAVPDQLNGEPIQQAE